MSTIFFSDNVGKIRVFSIKVALATLCAGKLMDKLRCKSFTQPVSLTDTTVVQFFRRFLTNI